MGTAGAWGIGDDCGPSGAASAGPSRLRAGRADTRQDSDVHRRAGAQRWGQDGCGAATGKGGRWAADDGGLRGEAGAGQGGARGDAIGQSSRVHRRGGARRRGVKTRIASGRLAAESGAVFKVDGGG